jgi:hypothetical protein
LVYASQFYSNAQAPESATDIPLANGEERDGVDFSLQPVSGVTIAGSIVNGVPRDAVAIRLLPISASAFTSNVGLETAVTAADARGHFELVGVPAGDYVLDASERPAPLVPRGSSFAAGTNGEVAVLQSNGAAVSLSTLAQPFQW